MKVLIIGEKNRADRYAGEIPVYRQTEKVFVPLGTDEAGILSAAGDADVLIAGAGFDTIAPEPTGKDNPLVDLHPAEGVRVLYSPHIGGVTTGSFRRGHHMLWENVERIGKGERPHNVVNHV